MEFFIGSNALLLEAQKRILDKRYGGKSSRNVSDDDTQGDTGRIRMTSDSDGRSYEDEDDTYAGRGPYGKNNEEEDQYESDEDEYDDNEDDEEEDDGEEEDDEEESIRGVGSNARGRGEDRFPLAKKFARDRGRGDDEGRGRSRGIAFSFSRESDCNCGSPNCPTCIGSVGKTTNDKNRKKAVGAAKKKMRQGLVANQTDEVKKRLEESKRRKICFDRLSRIY